MKYLTSLLVVLFLMITTGCATSVSTSHGYGHHNHISVGTHGRSNGAVVVGALIVGGIIGSIVKENEHKKQEQAKNMAVQRAKATAELRSVSTRQKTQIESIEYRETLSSRKSEMQWVQLGKDNNCYLMSVNNGVTNIVSAIPIQKCENPK
jgi:hypothetical protein